MNSTFSCIYLHVGHLYVYSNWLKYCMVAYHTTLYMYFDVVFVKKFVLLNLTCRMYHFIKASFYFGSCLSCLKTRLVI